MLCGKLLRYFNTVKYLRPLQIAGQLTKPYLLRSMPSPEGWSSGSINLKTMIPALDLNKEYLSRFDVEQLMRSEITLLGETHWLDLTSWNVDAAPLWRFNLHYFEYAVALAAAYKRENDRRYYDKFKELFRSWTAANAVGIGDGWHPYTISIRIPNLFTCFDLFGEAFNEDTAFYKEALASVYTQYRTLLKRKEIWQMGNHYFENLKSIALCALAFNETEIFEKYIKLFINEVNEEVLPDGVHFELSAMYHKIILEDILRAAWCLKQKGNPQLNKLMPVIQKMVNAVASLEKGMGKTPFFNDAADGVAKDSASLIQTAWELFGIKPVLSEAFVNSGYYKLYDGDIAVLFDAGKIGPDYMPGHGHCDCLSFELSVDTKPLFVNSGTYQYQGKLRGYFRSTRAHNTVTIGERDQSECWGEHRVARRISNVHAKRCGQAVTASYTSYFGDIHTREISLTDYTLNVLDSTQSKNVDTVRSFLHIAPGHTTMQDNGRLSVLAGGCPICEIAPLRCEYKIHTSGDLSVYAPKFGSLQKKSCLEFYWTADNSQHGYSIRFYKKGTINNNG